MTNVAELVSSVESRGIRLIPLSGALRVIAPRKGMLTEDLRAKLTRLKPEILQHLNTQLELEGELTYLFNERASTLELRLPRAEAERVAVLEIRATPQFRQWQGNEYHSEGLRSDFRSLSGS